LADECLVNGAAVDIRAVLNDLSSYTGLQFEIPAEHPAYLIPSEHPAVVAARRVLQETNLDQTEPGIWRFATDGGHFAQAGLTVIGFGPGDDLLAHTSTESIEISAVETALQAYEQLAMEWPKRVSADGGQHTG
jgi:acetylornithine deacetylase/succinyl-diaminopimelate desuccinylase-like protein